MINLAGWMVVGGGHFAHLSQWLKLLGWLLKSCILNINVLIYSLINNIFLPLHQSILVDLKRTGFDWGLLSTIIMVSTPWLPVIQRCSSRKLIKFLLKLMWAQVRLSVLKELLKHSQAMLGEAWEIKKIHSFFELRATWNCLKWAWRLQKLAKQL